MATILKAIDQKFLNMARALSFQATCPRRQVGSVLVNDARVIGMGFNAALANQPQCNVVGCLISYGRCVRALHAEFHALLEAIHYHRDLQGATLYTTFLPCSVCATLLSAAGIGTVVYQNVHSQRDLVEEIFRNGGVTLIQAAPTN